MTTAASDSALSGLTVRSLVALLCVLLILPGDARLLAQNAEAAAGAPAQPAPAKLPPEQLDSLVAPIALYPDPMLSQTLVASTYPLEIIQLQQWLEKNKGLKDKALADAVQKQDWDPSIQAMASLPDVVKKMAEGIKWTSDLGNAFLTQQEDVMEAVQRMRKKAKDAGALKTTEQQKVETKVVETKTVVVIEQANPQVIYVPTYNPVVVYGPPVYPYPPIVYPPPPPPPPPGAYIATAAIAFGVGVAMGAAYHGGWGYHCGWGHSNTVVVNHNNVYVNRSANYNKNVNYNQNVNYNKNQNVNRSVNQANAASSTWQHNPQHRGAVPYSNQATASKYGGSARTASPSSTAARQGTGRTGGGAQAGTANRGAQPSTMNRGTGNAGASAGNMSASRGGSGQAGSRQVSNSGTASKGAFGGASSGMSGNSAKGQQPERCKQHGILPGLVRPRRAEVTAMIRKIVVNSTLLHIVQRGTLLLVLAAVPAAIVAAEAPAGTRKGFDSPQAAVDALVKAAEENDKPALNELFGPEAGDLIETGDPVQDSSIIAAFAAKAREKSTVAVDPHHPARAILSVGADAWPFPVPIVNRKGKWYFATAAGRQEILYRRIGANELDAIQICRGFAEAQWEYASAVHDSSGTRQFAQKIISSPGKQDGLYWVSESGIPGGPIGETVARAIEEGYAANVRSGYHGYYFKVLKGQGASAPLGELDYVIEGLMIGGFALIATPVEYGVTGVKTFMVGPEGMVYEKDFGADSLKIVKNIERHDPDKTWHPTQDEWPGEGH